MPLEAKSLDEEMAADWAAIQEKHAEPEEEIETPDPEPAQADDTPEPVADARARRDDGTFLPKEKTDAKGKESEVPRGDPADPVALQPALQTPVERDVNRAPSTWKPTARADFDKLPPAVKTEIHRRETDFMNGQAQLLPDAKLGRSVTEIMSPYRMLIEAEGGTPERAIADLMRTAAIFRVGTPQQKSAALQQIARQFNVELAPPQPAQPGQQPQTLQDPRVDQLLAQLNQERQQRQRDEQSGLETAVTSWMGEVDAKGAPVRPYLGDVMNEMSGLVPQIRQGNPSLSHNQVLQEAYDRAIWGNPEIRKLLQQQEAQGNEQARRTENQNRVRDARRAASVNVPRRASTPSAGKPGSLDETLSKTARELGLIT